MPENAWMADKFSDQPHVIQVAVKAFDAWLKKQRAMLVPSSSLLGTTIDETHSIEDIVKATNAYLPAFA